MEFCRREPLLLLGAIGSAVLWAAFALLRHRGFGSTADLAAFDQAVWHYSRLEPPDSTIVPAPSLLGDHFHPLVALLTPLYWLWSSPNVLLIAQAALLAASIVPVFLFARDRLGRLPAYLLAAAYAAFWGMGSGAAFDFHALAFAPLLIGLAVLAIDRGQWRLLGLWVVLMLLVKEDLALFVAFLGVYLIARREPLRGLATAAVGIGWYFLATRALIPHFAGDVGFRFWSYQAFGADLPSALANVVQEPWRIAEVAVDDPRKQATLLWLFAPFLFLGLASPLVLLMLPLLAERLLSANVNYWSTIFHYSLAIAPLLAMGAAEGLANVARLARSRSWRLPVQGAWVLTGVTGAILAANIAASVTLSPLGDLSNGSFYALTPAERVAADALERIPPGASVATQNKFIAHLSERDRIYLLTATTPPTDWVLADLSDTRDNPFPNPSWAAFRELVRTRMHSYETVVSRDGLVLLERRRGG